MAISSLGVAVVYIYIHEKLDREITHMYRMDYLSLWRRSSFNKSTEMWTVHLVDGFISSNE